MQISQDIMICRNLLSYHTQSSTSKNLPNEKKKRSQPYSQYIYSPHFLYLFVTEQCSSFPYLTPHRCFRSASAGLPYIAKGYSKPFARANTRTGTQNHTLTALVHMRPNQPNNINNMGIWINEEQRLQSTFIHPCSILQRGHRPQRSCVELMPMDGWQMLSAFFWPFCGTISSQQLSMIQLKRCSGTIIAAIFTDLLND